MISIKFLLLLSVYVTLANGHGRLLDPASRGSAWRKGFKTPVDYNDEGLYCGGYSTQWKNNGQCGVCGDAITQSNPRSHELFGNIVTKPPVITKTYSKGQTIDLEVQLTANHGGFFVFQICSANDRQEVTEQCLEQNTLIILNQSSTPISNPPDGDDQQPIDGNSAVDDTESSSTGQPTSPSNQHHYDRHPIDLKKNIRTVKNIYNEDKYNYEHVQADVESANAHLISGLATGNRFNPVTRDPQLDVYKYRIPFEKAKFYTISVRLPQDLTCERCVLRWIYVAGNSWGVCDRTGYRGAVGCGPQEEFRNCADITIR